MSRVVRQSKYRHVFGKAEKPEECVDNVVISKTAWDSNYIATNNTFFGVLWQTAGGGAIGVVPHTTKGKLPQQGFPLITGHKAAVLDIDWNPFNDHILASVSEDCYVKLWNIPEGGLKDNMTDAVQTMQGHRRKVGTVKFHPTASNVLATSSQDYTIKLWDIETGQTLVTLDGPTDLIQSVAWNYDGSLIGCTSKDKQNRVADPRTGKFSHSANGHEGVKGSRCMWVADKLFTVGFSKSSERQYALYDLSDLSKPLLEQGVDNSSGILCPYYDVDTKMIYLAGKGDGNIRYYEYDSGEKMIYHLSEFKSNTPTVGGVFVNKTACNVSENEVARFLKLENRRMVPISFTVPRKSDLFQDDIFPPTASGVGEPSMTRAEYMSGKNVPPKTVSLEKGFTAKPKTEVAFVAAPVDEGPKDEKELRKAYVEQKNRIAFLETSLKAAELKLSQSQK